MTGTKYRERVLASMLVGVLALSVSVPRVNGADAELPNARSVPRAQAIPLPHEQVSLQADGVELTRLHFGADDLRPFNYPVNGPTGRSLTRMGHPHDPVGHSHHNSIWISHHDVNGVSFWADQGQGRIVFNAWRNWAMGKPRRSF